MTLPNTFAALTAPQMVFLDQNFAAATAMGIIPCTASGTNLITLTPNANTPTVSAYANYQQFSFVAANSTTGAVTLQVGALPALNVYLPDSSTQAAGGSLSGNFFYVVAFNQALNSGAGGFVIVSSQVSVTQANSIAANVLMTATSTFFDGPTITQGTAGTWFASGTATFTDASTAATITAILWDGTTVVDTSTVTSGGANQFVSISLSGIFAPPAGNIRISAIDSSTTSGKFFSSVNTPAGTRGNASTITAIRLR